VPRIESFVGADADATVDVAAPSPAPKTTLSNAFAENPVQRISRFGGLDACHTTEVDGTFAQKARTAIDLVAQNLVKITER
jgi:hypothetical protein